MKFQIALVEDDIRFMDHIVCLLTKMDEDIFCSTFDSAEAFLNDEGEYDMAILDIDLSGMDGITLSKRLKPKQTKSIVFLTSYRDRMQEAFQQDVAAYIMKSEPEKVIRQKFKRIVNKLKETEYLMVKSALGEICLQKRNIISAYIENRRFYIACIDGNVIQVYNPSFSQFAQENEDHFVQCNRSCIINPQQIQKIEDHDVYLTNGKREPISRLRYEQFKKNVIRAVR